MTKEGEEIEILKAYRDKLSNSTSNQLDKDIKAFDAAIEALEQQPFMNKPCVAHQICHEDKIKVLDKIRDEVCLIDDNIVLNPDSLYERRVYVRLIDVTDIIDKYTAESEDKE